MRMFKILNIFLLPVFLAFGSPQALAGPQSLGSFDRCADLFPGQQPLRLSLVSPDWRPLALCSDQFAVIYSQRSKTPLVVIERLNAAQLQAAKNERRTDDFYPDPRIPREGRADLSDYHGSGFDRGHMAPAADMPSARAMAQSFALSNMVPQAPENNRGVWAKRVEAATRHYVERADGDVYVFTGPAFNGPIRTIGKGQVWVPSHLYKLVYDPSARRAWAFWVENTDGAKVTKPISYQALVQRLGFELLKDAYSLH